MVILLSLVTLPVVTRMPCALFAAVVVIEPPVLMTVPVPTVIPTLVELMVPEFRTVPFVALIPKLVELMVPELVAVLAASTIWMPMPPPLVLMVPEFSAFPVPVTSISISAAPAIAYVDGFVEVGQAEATRHQ